jgi:hypothetical protein
MKLNRETKQKIFKELSNQTNPFGEFGEESFLSFLDAIFDLKKLPSEDERFSNAYEDAYQHTINNYDWDEQYIFENRFDIFTDDSAFIKFLETVVHPSFRLREDQIVSYVYLINPFLEIEGLQFYLHDHTDNSLPIYKIKEKNASDNEDLFIKDNSIPFYVLNEDGDYNVLRKQLKKSEKNTNKFLLELNTGWNDYGFKTVYQLYFSSGDYKGNFIGSVKIIDNTDERLTNLPSKFYKLNEDFCSLGKNPNYYKELRETTNESLESVLLAIRDCAFFVDIQDSFSKKKKYIDSIIRYDGDERMLREAKYIAYGYDLSNLYKFTYHFQPNFSERIINVNLSFDDVEYFPNRVYGMIGKNGTGKTQFITSLPLAISKRDNELPRGRAIEVSSGKNLFLVL